MMARGLFLPFFQRYGLSFIETPPFARHRRAMAKSIALLFSGQGAQQVGMGKDLIATVRCGSESICRGRCGTRLFH